MICLEPIITCYRYRVERMKVRMDEQVLTFFLFQKASQYRRFVGRYM